MGLCSINTIYNNNNGNHNDLTWHWQCILSQKYKDMAPTTKTLQPMSEVLNDFKGSEEFRRQRSKVQQLQYSFNSNGKDFWFCRVRTLQLLPGTPQAGINSPPGQAVEPLNYSQENILKSKFIYCYKAIYPCSALKRVCNSSRYFQRSRGWQWFKHCCSACSILSAAKTEKTELWVCTLKWPTSL